MFIVTEYAALKGYGILAPAPFQSLIFDPGSVLAVLTMSSLFQNLTTKTFKIPFFFHFVIYKDPKEYINQNTPFFIYVRAAKALVRLCISTGLPMPYWQRISKLLSGRCLHRRDTKGLTCLLWDITTEKSGLCCYAVRTRSNVCSFEVRITQNAYVKK